MGAPGLLNSLTDVPGIWVGQAVDQRARTGVTVILSGPEMTGRRLAASVDVRGGGPGTRETELLRPEAMVREVDAICLAGGSVFGLDAASGVTHWLHHQRRGLEVHGMPVPIVPAAILFDLANGGDKNWSDQAAWGGEPPYRRLGWEACAAAGSHAVALGNAGAGYGAAAGRIKGGLGAASWVEGDGLVVAALVAANPVGSVLRPGEAAFWAEAFEQQGEFGGSVRAGKGPDRGGDMSLTMPAEARIGAHTCIGVVATNARLDKSALRHVASMAHDGLARAIRPVHTPFDGDTLFAVASAMWPRAEDPVQPYLVARIGALAADCVARAVARAVWEAEPLGILRSARQVFGVDGPE